MNESIPPPGEPKTAARPAPLIVDARRNPARRALLAAPYHAAAALLAAAALFFTAWFVYTNPAMLTIFRALLLPWSWGDALDSFGFAWAVIGAFFFIIIGWSYLEGLELYLPRTAALALAWIFGLGLAGFVFECLAIPNHLTRTWVALALCALVLALLARAWRRGRRLPESGLGGGTEWREQLMRRIMARRADAASLARPRTRLAQTYCALVLALLAAITFLIFWHALLYPEVYWDSMILYLGYARQTFLEHGFPVKVTGQVGIGLGANYPHLFSVLGSGVAALSGAWSELPQRLIAPLCGVATVTLIYHSALRLTRHVAFALTIALLYRATPLGIIYDQYASDYALVTLFGAAFFYLSILYIETGLIGYLASSALLIGLAMHLNYLMGILWPAWALTLVLGHLGAARHEAWVKDPAIAAWAAEAPWTLLPRRATLWGVLRSRRFWWIVLGAVLIGSTWHIRNWIVTGNPVYAFFYKILGGKHVSDEVMKASAIEWGRNGAGIGRLGDTLMQRLEMSWGYFAGLCGFDRKGEPVFWRQYYQTAPLALGFAAGGFMVWAGLALAAPLARRRQGVVFGAPARFGLVAAALLFGLLAFHYILAPFYLYQIIGILPCLALLAALAWPFWRRAPWLYLLGGLALFIGVVPGLANALMGYKIVNLVELPGAPPETQFTLFALRHPLPSARQMYRWRYGEDEKMWEYLNTTLKDRGERLLTHENRDLALHPTITIVNLDDWTDDWNIQELWTLENPVERVRQLILNYHIHYYLRVPNEDACPTNAKLGAADWPKLGLASEIFRAGDNVLYELKLPSDNGPTTGTMK